ncbi:hemerythrin domain-containing protein [Phenylobacterium soli]|uniref:Hemerythrin domain-containing protein n=1 Tax=Phenylobacterium soli TaxID=2170551 RepID=A0A328AKT4_9CAUL|nr:hemerythrin domain-containing protein [Phenylobacterium soli]RAK55147.1 hemerythrin domain-containing protein [Phenylobacterium soli]
MSAILAATSAPAKALAAQPLEWFLAEHLRHRQFCGLMAELALAKSFEPEPIRAVIEFLRHELGHHLADEEVDLFPLLRARALPEDEIGEVLDRLIGEHKADMAHAHALRGHLERCLDERLAPGRDPSVALALDAFASQELRHLALENAVVLPLARLRFAETDLKALGRRLIASHGKPGR